MLTKEWTRFNGHAIVDFYDLKVKGVGGFVYYCIPGKGDNCFHHLGSSSMAPIPFSEVEQVRKGSLTL